MDRDFEIGGRKFKLSKIDAFKQFHIVRRVGPILSDLIPAAQGAGKFSSVGEVEKLTEEQKGELFAKLAQPVMNGLAKLSDADADTVLKGLLSAVEMQHAQTGSWIKVVQNDMVMVQDLELATLVQMAGRAFMFNLAGFFAALPQK